MKSMVDLSSPLSSISLFMIQSILICMALMASRDSNLFTSAVKDLPGQLIGAAAEKDQGYLVTANTWDAAAQLNSIINSDSIHQNSELVAEANANEMQWQSINRPAAAAAAALTSAVDDISVQISVHDMEDSAPASPAQFMPTNQIRRVISALINTNQIIITRIVSRIRNLAVRAANNYLLFQQHINTHTHNNDHSRNHNDYDYRQSPAYYRRRLRARHHNHRAVNRTQNLHVQGASVNSNYNNNLGSDGNNNQKPTVDVSVSFRADYSGPRTHPPKNNR